MTQDLRVLTTSRAPLGLSSEAVYLLPELSLPTAAELFIQRPGRPAPAPTCPPRWWRRSAATWTGCRWPWSWRRRGSGCCRWPRSPAAWRTASACWWAARRRARAPPDPRGRGRLELEPAGAVRAGGDAGAVGLPGRVHRRRRRRALDGDDADVAEVLEHLVDQSLLQVADTPAGARFRMPETVREFSTPAGGGRRPTGRSAASWPGPAIGVPTTTPSSGPTRSRRQRIRAEQDNLAQALRHGLARADGDAVAATSAVLGGLWIVESVYPLLVSLTAETTRLLSHFRPGPGLVEATRTTLALSTAYTFLLQGPAGARWSPFAGCPRRRRTPWSGPWRPCSPAAAQDRRRPVRALRQRRAAGGRGRQRRRRLLLGERGRPGQRRGGGPADAGGLRAAKAPYLEAVAHARISELCLQAERGEEALRHLLAVLPVLEQLGIARDLAGLQWWLVLANLQVGDVDQAERWLEQTAPSQADEPVGSLTYGLGVRAEILLARGEVEAGLRLWRRAVDLLARRQPDLRPGRGPEPGDLAA